MKISLLIALMVLAFAGPLDPNKIPKFQTNLTINFPVHRPKVTFPSGNLLDDPYKINDLLAANPTFISRYTVTTKEISQQILPKGFPETKVYAYGGDCYDSLTGESLGQTWSWPGPAFLLQRYGRVETTWRNGLRGKHMFAIQRNIDFMRGGINFDSFIPNVAHMHGMANPSKSDGVPEAWFTNDGQQGDHYFTNSNPQVRNASVYPMANQQEEATMFYHDHSIGMTRLNFYAGLSGFLAIQDPQSHLSRSFDRFHDIFLSIADRSFNEDGSLFYPDKGLSQEFPVWNPFFQADVMTVNGKAYPNLNVEQNRYRVRLLNAGNRRPLTISFVEEISGKLLPFYLYKSDSCYHYQPIQLTALSLPVAHRAEIVLDFTLVRTGRVIMRNVPMPAQAEKDNSEIPNLINPSDFPNIPPGVTIPGLTPPNIPPTVAVPPAKPSSTDQIMSFTPNIRVATPIKKPSPAVILNSNLNIFPFTSLNPEPKYYALTAASNAKGQPIAVLINGVKMSADKDVFKMEKDYELYFINLMPIAHPMHVHLVNFQVYKRAPVDSAKYTTDWLASNPGTMPFDKPPKMLSPEAYLKGPWEKLGGVHRVWRDMTDIGPNAVNVVRMRFMFNTLKRYGPDVRGSLYVMHCHILEHEDNEMMRYFAVE